MPQSIVPPKLLTAALIMLTTATGTIADGIKVTHAIKESLCDTPDTRAQSISTFCLAPDGNLFVADGEDTVVRLISPTNELLRTVSLPFSAGALACSKDGNLYAAGGEGRVVRADSNGTITASCQLGTLIDLPSSGRRKDTLLRRFVAAFGAEQDFPLPQPGRRQGNVAGLAVTDEAVFVALRGDTSYDVYRLTPELTEPTRIITRLRGCCGQMDIDALGQGFVVAENSRHTIKVFDRDGKLIRQFGKSDPTSRNGFGSCCGPMNVTVAGGKILTGETVRPEALIKEFDAEGKQLAVVGSAKGPASCSRMTLAATPDTRTVYMLDGHARPNVIRVFRRKE